MKRSVLVAAAVLALATLASCGKTEESPSTASAPANGAMPGTAGMPGMAPAMPEKRFDDIAKEYKAEYVETAQVQQCLAQSVHSCVGQSIMSKAQGSSDIKICDDLSEPNFRANCKSMVINAKATQKGDPEVCKDLEEYANRSCVSQALIAKAKKLGNLSVCNDYRKFFPIQKAASGAIAAPGSWTEETLSAEIRNCTSTVLMETAKTEKECDSLKGTMPYDACVSNVRMREQMKNPPAPQPAAAISTGTSTAPTPGNRPNR
jgi:hypothetical protein